LTQLLCFTVLIASTLITSMLNAISVCVCVCVCVCVVCVCVCACV
jgi:hypothetical protein